jgi:hypothetical protein
MARNKVPRKRVLCCLGASRSPHGKGPRGRREGADPRLLLRLAPDRKRPNSPYQAQAIKVVLLMAARNCALGLLPGRVEYQQQVCCWYEDAGRFRAEAPSIRLSHGLTAPMTDVVGQPPRFSRWQGVSTDTRDLNPQDPVRRMTPGQAVVQHTSTATSPAVSDFVRSRPVADLPPATLSDRPAGSSHRGVRGSNPLSSTSRADFEHGDRPFPVAVQQS